MKSLLTEKLETLGFFCGIEQELYLLDTGKHTSLIIEGRQKSRSVYFYYDFYKQTFSPHFSNKIVIYGENLNAPTLLRRVEKCLLNREKYLSRQ